MENHSSRMHKETGDPKKRRVVAAITLCRSRKTKLQWQCYENGWNSEDKMSGDPYFSNLIVGDAEDTMRTASYA